MCCVGLLCAARYTNNNAWYRAVVTETSGLSKITVQYVDYGNSETLPLERLKWLSNDYLEMPVMVTKLTVIGFLCCK